MTTSHLSPTLIVSSYDAAGNPPYRVLTSYPREAFAK